MKTRWIHSVSLAALVVGVALDASADPTKQECVAAYDKQQALRGQSKLRAARAAARVCASASCGRVSAECGQAAFEIDKLVPTIVFEARDGEGHDVATVKVLMDGEKLTDTLDGTAIELDVGEHEFTFEGAGKTVRQRFVIREGERGRHERIVLGTALPPASATPIAPPDGTKTSDPTPRSEPGDTTSSNGTGQRIAGGVLVGLGVVGAALGTAFAVIGNSNNNDLLTICPAGQGTSCTAATALKATVTTDWVIAGVGLGVGGTAIVAGAILFFTAASGKKATSAIRVMPSVAPGSLGLALVGSF